MTRRIVDKQLILIRGLPGAGKTTLSDVFHCTNVSADDFFYYGEEYRFDPKKLAEAHKWCQDTTRVEFNNPYALVAVHNTFCELWEILPYKKIAEECGATLTVISLFDGGFTDEELFERNTHGVPLESIKAMRERFEHDWRNGNPTPPWERGK